jgi:hypothetical protein
MNTKASSFLVSAIIVIGLAGLAQGQHSYPKVGNYYTDRVDREKCEALSKWDVVVLNRRALQWNPEAVTTLRTLNPDIKILTYFPVAAIWAGYDTLDTPARVYGQKAETCDWWLYDTKGNRLRNSEGSTFINFSIQCPEDASGRRVDEWLADHIADQIALGGPWDGLLLDIMFENAWWLNNTDWFEDPPAMIDLNRDGVGDPSDSVYVWWRQSILSFLDHLRERVGPSYILVGNGKHCLGDYLNGGIREDFPYMHGGWEENMFSEYGYMTLCRELLHEPMTCVMMLCFWRDDDNTLYLPERTGSYEKFLRYTLCSALLGDGYYFLQGGSGNLWWEDYYDLDLGGPTSEAYLDSLWNNMYHRYSPVWRRDFENASVYCNPFDEYISCDEGWLSPQDGLIRTLNVPSSAGISLISGAGADRTFDRSDPWFEYGVTIGNNSVHAVFVDVWANLVRGDVPVASSRAIEYMVGARDTLVKDRMIRLPPNLRPGSYLLEVMVGGHDYIEVDRDTMTVFAMVDHKKEQMKGSDGGVLEVSVGPQPALLGAGDISVEVKVGSMSGGLCSIRMYDVAGRLVKTVFEDRVDCRADFVVSLDRPGGVTPAPGVYLLSVSLEKTLVTKKVVLLRP